MGVEVDVREGGYLAEGMGGNAGNAGNGDFVVAKNQGLFIFHSKKYSSKSLLVGLAVDFEMIGAFVNMMVDAKVGEYLTGAVGASVGM